MRGVYTLEIEIAALSAAKTVLSVQAPDDMVLEILSASIANMATDTAEQLEAGLFMATTVGTPAGTSITPEKHETGDVASTVTALGDLTTEPTTYSSKGIDRQGWNNLAGYRYDPIPEEKPVVSPSGLIGLRLLTAPSAAFKAACQMIIREIGG